MHPDGLADAFDVELAEVVEVEVAGHELGGLLGEIRPTRLRQGLHPLRQPHRMANRGVFDAQVLADRTHHDLARVDAHPHREAQPVAAAHLGGIGGKLTLQRERRPAGALCVILVGERSAEERHDPIAGELVNRALEAVNTITEDREEPLHDPPPDLRVGPLGQVHRADHVREQHRDLLTLPIQIGPRTTDPLREMLRGIRARIALGRRPRRRVRPLSPTRPRTLAAQRVPARIAELLPFRIRNAAAWTRKRHGQRRSAPATEAGFRGILMTT